MAGNLVTIRIDADAARAISQINATALSLDRLDKSGGKAGRSFTQTGRRLTATGATLNRQVTVPIALAGGAAIKTAIDFDQSMNRIQSLVGASTEQVDKFSNAILDLAPTVGKSPKELADALYFITSSGFSGAAALDVLTISAKASASGLGDTKTVADAVTSAVNAYGKDVLSASDATDILTATVREGKGEPAELAESLGRVVAPAEQLGVSFDQVGASLSSLTLLGLDADEAVTGLTGLFRSLSKPSVQGAKALEEVGLSAKGLRQEVKDRGLLPTIIHLADAFDGNVEALRKVVPEQRAYNALAILTGKNVEQNIDVSERLSKAQGDTAAAFDKTANSARQNLNKSLAELQVAGIKAGNDLVPVLTDVVGIVGDMASAFSDLPEPVQHAIEGLLVFGATLGPIVSTAGNVSKVIGQFTDETSGAKTAFSGLSKAMAFLGPGGLVLGGAVAAIPIMLALSDNTDAVTRSMNNAADAAKNLDDALHNQATAAEDARSTQLDVADAADRLEASQKAVNRALRDHGKHSEAYRDALRQERRDELSLTVAHRRAKDAVIASGNAQQAASTQAANLDGKLREVVESARILNSRLGSAKGGADSAAAGLVGVANSIDSRTNPSLKNAIAYAASLIQRLQAIPNDVTTIIHTIQQITTIETNRAQGRGYVVPPEGALGAIVNRPTYALIGERGPEAVVPLHRTPGNQPLNSAGIGGITIKELNIYPQTFDLRKVKRDLDKITARKR